MCMQRCTEAIYEILWKRHQKAQSPPMSRLHSPGAGAAELPDGVGGWEGREPVLQVPVPEGTAASPQAHTTGGAEQCARMRVSR